MLVLKIGLGLDVSLKTAGKSLALALAMKVNSLALVSVMKAKSLTPMRGVLSRRESTIIVT